MVKKFLLTVILATIMLTTLPALTFSADTTLYVNGQGVVVVPENVESVKIVGDTIGDSTFVVYGPYKMAKTKNNKMFTVMSIYGQPLTSGDNIAVEYQTSYGGEASDIISDTWTIADTVTSSGFQKNVDLSSYAAKYIFIRAHNYDTASAVLGDINLIFKE